MANGVVFQVGATSHTALYNSSTGKWTAGPDTPDGLVNSDGPAALLPSGYVLFAAGPFSGSPTNMLEFNGTISSYVAEPPWAATSSPTAVSFLVLPTGQILATDSNADIEIYTPSGTPNSAWAPTISLVPSMLTHGSKYSIAGTQFNGLSQGASYGDDAQMATNYPLVRITNNSTGQVYFAKTSGFDGGVATGARTVVAAFSIPAGAPLGASSLVVVANGIASAPVSVTIN